MNKLLPRILILLLVSLLTAAAFAQKPKLKFKSIKASDGLINSTVQAIFEDSYGFIWLGTHHGLQRYDGKSFTNFTSEGTDSTGLSHNYINDFCEDDNGDIWIATSIGLNWYSREQDRIFHYRWKRQNGQQFDDLGATKVLHDDSDPDIIWITTGKSQLIRLNIRSDQADVYNLPIDGIAFVLMPLKTRQYQNHLLLGSTELFVFDKNSGQFSSVYALEQSNKVRDNRFNDAVFDPGDPNTVWLATGDIWGRGTLGGLLKLNLESGQSKLFTWKNRPGEIPDRHILTVCFSGPDKLWVGTRNYGALLYDLKQDRFFNYKYNEYDEGSLVTENAIRSMLLDQ